MIHPTFLPMPYMRAYVLYLSTLPFGTARRGRQRAEHTVRQHYGWVWTSKLRCEREARPGRTTRPTCRAGSLSAFVQKWPALALRERVTEQQAWPAALITCDARCLACLLISPHCLLCRPSSSINKAHT